MTTPKQPYTGPSQVVTTDTKRNIYIVVYQKAQRMTIYPGVYKDGQPIYKDNLREEQHPGLWAVVNLVDRQSVADNKFYVRLTYEELAAADEPLSAWVRQEATQALFRRNEYAEAKTRAAGPQLQVCAKR